MSEATLTYPDISGETRDKFKSKLGAYNFWRKKNAELEKEGKGWLSNNILMSLTGKEMRSAEAIYNPKVAPLVLEMAKYTNDMGIMENAVKAINGLASESAQIAAANALQIASSSFKYKKSTPDNVLAVTADTIKKVITGREHERELALAFRDGMETLRNEGSFINSGDKIIEYCNRFGKAIKNMGNDSIYEVEKTAKKIAREINNEGITV